MPDPNPSPTTTGQPHDSPPSSASPLSKHTDITTPDRQPSPPLATPTDPGSTNANALDDIWASDSPHPSPRLHPQSQSQLQSRPDAATATTSSRQGRRGEELLSDLPTLRRQHMTAGYREGLGVGKARVMQGGFDAGYPVGVEVGMRAGGVLGVLEGICAGRLKVGPRDGEGEGTDEGEIGARKEVQKLLVRARRELDRGMLLEGLDEEVLMQTTGVPERVEGVLKEWEGRVLGKDGLDLVVVDG